MVTVNVEGVGLYFPLPLYGVGSKRHAPAH